ncbi:hypothetical protein [Candidatus Allofournierella merdipullorum]|uniref:hypothetical protein n=1 Tax=Candidatus Allofournierella merdipullorum TaxID=2838595 RepID=UPI00374F60D5
MEPKELDVVLLRDGRQVTVLERYGDGEAFLVETAAPPLQESDTLEISKEEIAKIVYRA